MHIGLVKYLYLLPIKHTHIHFDMRQIKTV